MTNKKEKFHQSTIFDQMRYNAQDIVDAAKREYDDAKNNYEDAKNSVGRFYNESAEDRRYVKEEEDKENRACIRYGKARIHYAEIMDHIKEFEK